MIKGRYFVFGLIVVLVLVLFAYLPDNTPNIATADTAGFALEFDGNNDLVLLTETRNILGSGWEDTKSVELWVQPQATAEPCISLGDCKLVFGDQPRWWGVSHGLIGGLDRLWVWNADFTQFENIDYVGIPYTPGQWVHVSLVHEGGFLHVYQNGIEIGVVPSDSTKQPTSGFPELRLGGMIKDTIAWTFQGQIDEVRLWNIVRSPAQVQADLYRELTGSESGLMAYYKMSDGSGLTLTDDSGNGWNGELRDGYQNVPPDGSPPQWVTSSAFDLQPTFTPSPTASATPRPPTNTPQPTNTPDPSQPTNTPDPSQPTATGTPPPPGGSDIDIQMYLPFSVSP